MELRLENVTFSYRKGFKALDDVSASFGAGMQLLLGPNGAGKTTLLKVMAGLLCPQRGVCILGKEATFRHSPHAVKEIFLLSDDCNFPLDTVNDMVRLHAPFYPHFSAAFLAEALATFEMTGDEKLRDLSLGNRQKARVAYALSLGTRFLLLDEPANGLDITSKQRLATLLGRAMDADEDRCIIVATHTVQEMRYLFDSVTILNGGRVALNASTQLITERLAFINDMTRRPDALCYEPSIDGPSQVVPSDGSVETPIDYILLYTASIGPNSEKLKNLLS